MTDFGVRRLKSLDTDPVGRVVVQLTDIQVEARYRKRGVAREMLRRLVGASATAAAATAAAATGLEDGDGAGMDESRKIRAVIPKVVPKVEDDLAKLDGVSARGFFAAVGFLEVNEGLGGWCVCREVDVLERDVGKKKADCGGEDESTGQDKDGEDDEDDEEEQEDYDDGDEYEEEYYEDTGENFYGANFEH